MATLFIAEVSSNHQQSLDRCFEFIDKSVAVGCGAVKFQLFKVDQLFSKEARASNPRFNERKNWELPIEFIPRIANHCKKKNIMFSCTPFYLEAVDELEPYVDFFKVASYELLWLDLVAKIADTGKPLVLSTGMADLDEVREAVSTFRDNSDAELTLLHCVSGYPAPVANCNLQAINSIREEFEVDVGWSDHTRNPMVIQRAIEVFGAKVVEFHIDLDGLGDEFKTGHCWLPSEIRPVIDFCTNTSVVDGDGEKMPCADEYFERSWRADPSDGLRPLLEIRSTL